MKLSLRLSLVALGAGMLCSCGEGEKSADSTTTPQATIPQKEDPQEVLRKEIESYKAELAAVDAKQASDKLLDAMILPSDYASKLKSALKEGDVETFKLIMGGGDWAMVQDIGTKEAFLKKYGFDMLSYAGYCDSEAQTPQTMVKWALAAGVDVNAVNEKGMSALEEFAHNTDVSHMLYLLGAKTDNPLITAIIGNDIEAVKAELEKGADVNVKSAHTSASPLMYAIGNPDTTILSMLIAKGADVLNAPSPQMYTPIRSAVSASNLAAFNVLLDAGANVNDMYNDRTLLHLACSSVKNENGIEIIKILISKGLDVNKRATKSGFTPLMDLLWWVNANEKGDRYAAKLAALKVMLEAGADPDLTTTSGKSTRAMLSNEEKAAEFTQLLDAAATAK